MKKLLLSLMLFISAVSFSFVGEVNYLIIMPDGKTVMTDNIVDFIKIDYAIEVMELRGYEPSEMTKDQIKEFYDLYDSLVRETAEPDHLIEINDRIMRYMYCNEPQVFDEVK